jgi:hypothetical protein
VLHEVVLFEGLAEVEFITGNLHLPLFLHPQLLLCVFYAVSHVLEFIHASSEVVDLHVLVDFWSEGVFYVGISAGVAQLDGEGEEFARAV